MSFDTYKVPSEYFGRSGSDPSKQGRDACAGNLFRLTGSLFSLFPSSGRSSSSPLHIHDMDNRSEAPSALKRDEAKNEASRDPYVGLDSITEAFKGWGTNTLPGRCGEVGERERRELN